ncbi:hypothetical protein OAG63_00625 [Methylacidiphilales bacterium]|nr:hypothetical protein [Candidatus Methylacidiphilales bacterium]
MRNSALPTALERLIQPLPNDLKAAVLEAWKNEDIPHDENDSVYRLMVLLTLYVRYFEEIPKRITEAENRFTRFMESSLSRFERIWLKHVDTLQAAYTRIENLTDGLKKVETLLEEKPKSLRLQFETELKGLLKDTKSGCNEIQTGMAKHWAGIKEDQDTVTIHQHMTFMGVGILFGILISAGIDLLLKYYVR